MRTFADRDYRDDLAAEAADAFNPYAWTDTPSAADRDDDQPLTDTSARCKCDVWGPASCTEHSALPPIDNPF